MYYIILYYSKHFSFSSVWEDFRKQSADWLDDPEIYSLYDLTRVNSGELFQLLRQIVSNGMNHIIHCEVRLSIFFLRFCNLISFNIFFFYCKTPSYVKLVVSFVRGAILPK